MSGIGSRVKARDKNVVAIDNEEVNIKFKDYPVKKAEQKEVYRAEILDITFFPLSTKKKKSFATINKMGFLVFWDFKPLVKERKINSFDTSVCQLEVIPRHMEWN